MSEGYSRESSDGRMSQREPFSFSLPVTFFQLYPSVGFQRSSPGWCKRLLHIGGQDGRERGKRERDGEGGKGGRKKKTFTFCGFLASCRRPRIPHATHKVSIKFESNARSESCPPLPTWKEPFFWHCGRPTLCSCPFKSTIYDHLRSVCCRRVLFKLIRSF